MKIIKNVNQLPAGLLRGIPASKEDAKKHPAKKKYFISWANGKGMLFEEKKGEK